MKPRVAQTIAALACFVGALAIPRGTIWFYFYFEAVMLRGGAGGESASLLAALMALASTAMAGVGVAIAIRKESTR